MCLQCGFCGCWNNGHFNIHMKSEGHVFGMNSSNGYLFCFHCDRYIANVDAINNAHLARYWEEISEGTRVPLVGNADGLMGLANMGSTCFMSSILQCILHNPYMVNYLMNRSHSNNCKIRLASDCITCALEQMVTDFYGNRESRATGFVGLLTCSWQINENLAGYSQQDAHEFLQFVMNRLHTDYVHTHHTDGKDRACNCIAHNVFQGSLRSTIICNGCNQYSKETIDPFMDLSLDIVNKGTLDECLANFHKREQLHDFNYQCENCTVSEGVTKKLTINKLPLVCVLQLKRFEHSLNGTSRKLDQFIEYPRYLDMQEYCSNGSPEGIPVITYELAGIISHIGTVNEGHYISYVRTSGDSWFKFNDSIITPMDEEEVFKQQAYLLFYIFKQAS